MDTYPQQSPQGGSSKVWIYVIVGLVLACLCGIGVVGLSGASLYFLGRQPADTLPPIQDGVTLEPLPGTAIPFATPVEDGSDDGQADGSTDGGSEPAGELEVEEIDPGEPLHEPLGTEIEYSSDPPVGGHHYEVWMDPGLYEEVVEDGYLVHNLEHGYVIIWYNCDDLSGGECDTLKGDIQSVIDYFDGYKVIGTPRPGMSTVLALTSWGRLARLDAFDFALIVEFIERYQEDSPEPNAP